ncbi:MAG: porin family protein [Chlamydiia bacterium]|nr:porin family protein [Chlamydiia bacterium]
MKKSLSAGIVCALLTLCASLQASTCDECYCGFYGQAFGGLNWATDTDLKWNTGAHTDKFSYDLGWGIGAAVGHQWQAWAAEFEVSYRSNDTDKHTDSGGVSTAHGDLSAWAFMVNGYYRFYNECWDFTPYVGIGIGAARLSLDNTAPNDAVIDDTDTVFAYQGIAGVSYCVCDCWELFAEYRYLGTSDPEYRTSADRIDSEYGSHMVDVGIRFAIE